MCRCCRCCCRLSLSVFVAHSGVDFKYANIQFPLKSSGVAEGGAAGSALFLLYLLNISSIKRCRCLMMTQHELQTVRESSRGGAERRGGLCIGWHEAEAEAETAKMFFGDYKFARRQAAAPAAAAATCSSVYRPLPLPLPTIRARPCPSGINLCKFELSL